MLPGDKEQRTDAVKQQTEYHTPAVSEATDEKSCRNGHNEVSHIHRHLYKGRMCLRDIQYLLKVLVQYIQNGMGKSPQKEKRGNQNEGHKVLSAHQWYSFLFHNMIIPDNRCKAIDNCGCKDKQNSRSLPNIFLFAIVRSSFFSNFTAIIQC